MVVCGGMYWNFLRSPRKSSLVLHEKGFVFKKTVARFDELVSIRFGRDFSGVASAVLSVYRVLGVISRRYASVVASVGRSKEESVTLVFKTGKTKSLNGMLICPKSEDLERFLERLRAMHPGLLEETPLSASTATEIEDLPFKMRSL